MTDYHLQWSDGIRVLQAVKQRLPNCPVIMFTATGNEEIAVEAMKKGATLKVKAAGERGQSTEDTYSLNGVTQALKLLASNCP